MRHVSVTTAVLACALLTGCALTENGDDELRLAFLTQLDSVNTGVAIDPVRVAIVNRKGNVVESATQTITIALDTNRFIDGKLSGTLVAEPVRGVATFGGLSIDKPWSYAGPCCGYSFRATASGAAAVSSTKFYAYVGPANQLKFSTQPRAVTATSVLTVQVGIFDAAGNSLRNSAARVTLSLSQNPGGGVLGGEVSQLTTYGGAIFLVTISKPGTGYTLTASASTLESVTSAPFDVLPNP